MKDEEIIDAWFVSECKGECPDIKTHIKVAGYEDIEKLKQKLRGNN